MLTKKEKKSNPRVLYNLLQKLYYTAGKESAFSSPHRLYIAAKKEKKNVTFKQVKDFLAQQKVYTLHKPIRKSKKYRKTFANSLNQIHQCDLIDIGKLSKSNDGNRYILTCIDVLSRQGYAQPIKYKSSDAVIAGFRKIYNKKTFFPAFVHTDFGKEFLSQYVQQYFKSVGIKHYTSNSDFKAAICERFNRSLKSLMWKYFTQKHTNRYIEILPQLLLTYNSRYHRSIGRSPNSVTKHNQKSVWKYLYNKTDRNFKEPNLKYRINDLVRIHSHKTIFKKGYLQTYTNELFKIVDVVKTASPTVYKLIDLKNNLISGTFYSWELQKVRVPQH